MKETPARPGEGLGNEKWVTIAVSFMWLDHRRDKLTHLLLSGELLSLTPAKKLGNHDGFFSAFYTFLFTTLIPSNPSLPRLRLGFLIPQKSSP
jgi:hypothetical protein